MKDYKMRRKDRESDVSTAKEILENGEYGVLATIGEDGYPYGVPVNFAFDGEKIYFHCAKNAGHKQDNMKFSDKVSFTVVESSKVIAKSFTSKYRSTIVFGKVAKTEINKKYALELLLKKYSSEFMEEGFAEIEKAFRVTDIYEVSIDKISGKVNN